MLRTVFLMFLLCSLCSAALAQGPQPGDVYLSFDGVHDGVRDYVEVLDSDDFSVSTTGGLTIAAWMRPDTLMFRNFESTGYVHWLGKGTPARREWVFRMYNLENEENRPNRISFYVFNLAGGQGIGSYFQESVTAGEWIHVVGVADDEKTYIYKNGEFKRCDQYRVLGEADRRCQQYARDRWITPEHGTAPVRIGTRDFQSFFQGGLSKVRVWNRPLTREEIADLYASDAVPQGLVAEYLLNEGEGEIAGDTTGAHNGTIFGAIWATQE